MGTVGKLFSETAAAACIAWNLEKSLFKQTRGNQKDMSDEYLPSGCPLFCWFGAGWMWIEGKGSRELCMQNLGIRKPDVD